MKNHVFRPLVIVIALVALAVTARFFIVPKDFGIGDRGYMYSWHRNSNEDEWKAFPVKYNFKSQDCSDCHSDNYSSIMKSPHAVIKCENCHGPALNHPSEPAKLQIDKSRALCLRCHYPLPYPTSGRSKIKGIDPSTHNPDIECSACHNPHKPSLESMK
ncbi:MAG: cytochrome c3 family protein [Dissulfurispiraceae bacterium]